MLETTMMVVYPFSSVPLPSPLRPRTSWPALLVLRSSVFEYVWRCRLSSVQLSPLKHKYHQHDHVTVSDPFLNFGTTSWLWYSGGRWYTMWLGYLSVSGLLFYSRCKGISKTRSNSSTEEIGWAEQHHLAPWPAASTVEGMNAGPSTGTQDWR